MRSRQALLEFLLQAAELVGSMTIGLDVPGIPRNSWTGRPTPRLNVDQGPSTPSLGRISSSLHVRRDCAHTIGCWAER